MMKISSKSTTRRVVLGALRAPFGAFGARTALRVHITDPEIKAKIEKMLNFLACLGSF